MIGKQNQLPIMSLDRNSTRASGETAEQLADFLMLAQRSCFLEISRDLNAGRISYAQLFLLGCLEQAESLTMSEIAKKMGHSTAAATGLVDRLQKLGYVARMKILVMITEKGRRILRKMREGLASSLAKMLVQMDGKPARGVSDSARQVLSAVQG
jgi:DNA-binding MarR family transcriptional regulator